MLLKDANKDGYTLHSIDSIMRGVTKCDYCSTELTINSGLSKLTCENKECKLKIAYRLIKFIKVLDGLLIDKEEALAFIEKHNIHKLVDILHIEESSKIGDSLEVIRGVNDYTLASIIEAISIPYTEGISGVIVGNYTNINDFYTDLNNYGIVFLNTHLNYVNDEIIILPKIAENLLYYKDEVIEFCSTLNKLSTFKRTLRVSINIGCAGIDKLKDLTHNYNLVISPLVYCNTDIIIGDSESALHEYKDESGVECEVFSSVEDAIIYLNSLN